MRLAPASLLVGLACTGSATAYAAEASGAAASDPTAAVNYQDFRYRYFDIADGRERHSFETEGAFMLRPRLKGGSALRKVCRAVVDARHARTGGTADMVDCGLDHVRIDVHFGHAGDDGAAQVVDHPISDTRDRV